MSDATKQIYNKLVANNFINYDKKQEDLISIIEITWQQSNKKSFFSKSKKFNGIYVYGSVGIGKTFIINLFIQNIDNAKQIHFNHFMLNLHAFINNAKNKESALEIYIKNFAKEFSVIFIDELHIFNIVDALLIKKIFVYFKKYKIFILVSSNFSPEELYKDGLQRNDFLPFIQLIKENFKVLYFEQMKDYRRLMLNQSKTYFTPINEETNHEFNKLFYRFVDKNQIHIRKIQTKSRIIRFEKCTSNIVYCKFEDLCLANLAHDDYRNIASTFNLIFISNVPQFTQTESDQCRRFISLIDMLYDQQCSVVLLAEYPINALCQIKNLTKEFKRTTSRLYEMTIISSDKK